MTLAARAWAWAFAAGVLAVLLALLLFTVGSPDGRSHQELPLPPGGMTLEPGATVGLPLELRGASAEYRLMVRCLTREPCTQIRLADGSAPDGRAPEGLDAGRPYFRLHRAEDRPGLLRFTNAGAEPLTLVRASVRNFAANNDQTPRFVVFLDGAARRPYDWLLRLTLLVAGVGLQAAGLAAWGIGRHVGLRSPRALAVAAPPLLGLGAALAVSAGGRVLVIPWDGFLFLTGLGLGVRLVLVLSPQAGRWVSRAWQTGAFSRTARGLLGVLPALFPALVLFVYLPLAIYLPNQADFNYHGWTLFPFAAATAAWTVVAVGLLVWRPVRRDALEKGCFFLGLLVLLLDLVTPLEIDVLDGRAMVEVLHIPTAAVWIQGAVTLAVLLFALTVRWTQVRPLAQLVSLGLLVAQAVTLTVRLAPETRWPMGVQSQPGWSAPPSLASRNGNIYHIILDAFSSQVLPEVLEADPALRSLLGGFTFFANARANMLNTTESMPSFMTGSFFPPKAPEMSELDWWRKVVPPWRDLCSIEGILKHAWEQGYTITQYVPRMEWCPHHKTTHFRLGADLQNSSKPLAGVADLWLLKLVPAPWKVSIFDRRNRGPFERVLREPSEIEWGYWSIAHMTQLIEEEARRPDRGQYVWAHFGTPHSPSVVDASCAYVGRGWRGNDASGYRAQAACAFRLAGRLIEALQRLQRFEAATIIVQSDHGEGSVDAQSPFNRMPGWLETRLDAESHQPGQGRETNNRSLALLLIKRPGPAREPLRTDERLVSLVDLPQTLYELHGWPARSPEGRSIFAPDLPLTRDWDLFVHFWGTKVPADGKRNWHLVFDGANWRIAPDYPTRIR